MRTLKRTLCLVLALVMMLGLCAINVGATSYTDDDDIAADYREALEVLTGIGVFNGKDDGSMGPQDALQRVQGCYLICKMLITPNGAGFASFSDVSAQDSPIVAYAQTLGITDGYGDNTFHPYDPLTGAAFAKWLLVALGYNAAAEGMTGYGWMGPTNQLTSAVGLSKGIAGYDPTETLTREQAAQMCLNALQATMVEYQGSTTVATGDTNISITGARVDVKNLTNTDYRTFITANSTTAPYDEQFKTMQFAERYFPLLKLEDNTGDPGKTTKAEELYNPVEQTWIYRSAELYRVLDTPVYSYSGKVKSGPIAADLSGYYIYSSGGSSSNHRMYVNDVTKYRDTSATPYGKNKTDSIITVNGVEAGNTQLNTASKIEISGSGSSITGGRRGDAFNFIGSSDANAVTLAAAIANLTQNGRKVDVYATDPDEPYCITDIVVTCYTVAKVRDVSASGGTTTYTFAAADNTGSITISGASRKTYDSVPSDNTLLTDAVLAKGDIITFTWPSGEDITSNSNTKLFAYPTEHISGVQTLWSNNNTAVIDGTTYDVATGVAKNDKYTTALKAEDDFSVNGPTAGEFYTDQFGYLVHSDTVANSDYAFIVAAYAKDNTNLNGTSPEVWVRAVLSDGTVGEYKVKTAKVSASNVQYWPEIGVTTDTYTKIDGNNVAGSGGKVWTIKNTDILIDSTSTIDGTAWARVSGGDAHLTVNNAAQILMSDAYGYIYNYKLDGDEIELIPITFAGNGYTDYDADGTAASGRNQSQSVVGQTNSQLMKSKQNYANAATPTNLGANYYGAPGAYGKMPGSGSTASTADTLLINASTTVVVYDSDSKTAKVHSGVGNLPSTVDPAYTLYGYFVGNPVSDGSNQLAAKIVFASNDGSYSSATKEYAYVTDTYEVRSENGVDVWYYEAYRMGTNGEKTQVKIANKSDYSVKGLYEIDEDNVIDGSVLAAEADTYSITSTTPYAFAGKLSENVVNGLIAAGDGTAGRLDWIVGPDTEIISINSGNYHTDDLILVLEVVNNQLTGYIKTVYALG